MSIYNNLQKYVSDTGRGGGYMVSQACHNFLSKSLRFLKCEKRARSSQFSEKPDSARVNHNFQKFSDLRHKKHVCWINHYNEHDITLFMSDFNESEDN